MSEPTLRPEVQDYITNLNQQLDLERTKRVTMETQLGQSGLMSGGDKNQNVIELQIDVEKILDKTYHLLSGHEVKADKETNNEYWAEPEDDRLKTFSSYGVKQVMNLLSMHINTNTLMAYYEEDTIKWKVRDFGVELSDLFTTRYESLLYYPSPEELQERYFPHIQKYGITEEELYKKCVKWSEDELTAKENLLPIIFWSLVNMVHSAYTRPYRGKERASLGERGININQSNIGQDIPMTPQKKGGILGMFKG